MIWSLTLGPVLFEVNKKLTLALCLREQLLSIKSIYMIECCSRNVLKGSPMSIASISALGSSGGYEGVQANQTSSTANSLASVLSNTNTATTTTTVTLTDGATVTTKRDKAGEILSISTSPPTRPSEVLSAKTSSGSSSRGISLLA